MIRPFEFTLNQEPAPVNFFERTKPVDCGTFAEPGNLRKYDSGAIRSNDVSARYDLICPQALLALGDTISEGLGKYGPDNWTKGMDIGETVNRSINHLYKFLSGDRSEPHLGHAMWGIMATIHFHNECSCHESRATLAEVSKRYAQTHGVKREK